MISNTTLTLLKYSKQMEFDNTWQGIAKVLAPIYYSDMKLQDVMHVLIKAYSEIISNSKFETGRAGGTSVIETLLFAPVKGHFSVDMYGPKNLETSYTVEQFYGSMLKHVVSEFRLARTDWLDMETGETKQINKPAKTGTMVCI